MHFLPEESESINQATTVLELKKRKWSFIPIAPLEKKPDSKLLIKASGQAKWKKFQHQFPTDEEMLIFSTAHSIAAITGKKSNIIVLDVDVKKGNGYKSLKGKQLPPTPTVITPSGGTHYYYKYPENYKVKSATEVLPNVDIRADGGYVLTPHSPGYKWAEGLDPESIEFAEAPDWILELCGEEMGGVPSNVHTLLDTPLRENNRELPKTVSYSKYNLRKWFSQEDVALAFLKKFGINKKIGESFNCIIPGHEETHPSAMIYPGNNGVYVYIDFHRDSDCYLLPEIYASIFYKKPVSTVKNSDNKINNPELVTWSNRLLIDLGFIKPYKVVYKELQSKVPETVEKVYKGFIKLLECKWLYSPNEPTPFTWKFGSAWCGVSYRKMGDALKWLYANGYIEVAETIKIRGRETSLYIPKID